MNKKLIIKRLQKIVEINDKMNYTLYNLFAGEMD